jgi:hypothetical protein
MRSIEARSKGSCGAMNGAKMVTKKNRNVTIAETTVTGDFLKLYQISLSVKR